MNRKISFALEEYYHLYNRGVEKRSIFLDEADYLRFQRALYFANSTTPLDLRALRNKLMHDVDRKKLVSIGAYVLMPNHFHLLVKEVVESGISRFMEKMMTSYAKYFNAKYDRVGSLFQGTFKSEHLHKDVYLKHMFAYIHLNPVKLIDASWREKGLKDFNKTQQFLEHYSYSSYLDYLGYEREEKLILQPGDFPEYFNGEILIKKEVEEWLQASAG